MKLAWEIVGVILLLLCLAWIVFFGGIGVVIARRMHSDAVIGFILGVLLGPFGWLLTWLLGRRRGARHPGRTRSALDDTASGGARAAAWEGEPGETEWPE